MSTRIDTLSSLELPTSLGIQRDHIIPEAGRPPQYDAMYDLHTLFYDAFLVPEDSTIRLICPRLLSLENLIKEATFTVNSERLEPLLRRRNWRNDEVLLNSPGSATELHLRYRSLDQSIRLGTQDRETFRGLRCAVLKSRDNDLAWIVDWARYHVKIHGLEGLVLFDNGSRCYSLEDIRAALLDVDGLKAARVLSADFPFGPPADGANAHEAKFLQGGLVEIARLRYFQEAASVLLVDIDELVAPVPESSIFDLAERSFLGCVSIQGSWRYPCSDAPAPFRHADHSCVARDELPCRPKYCIVPKGILGGCFWDMHIPGFGRSRLLLACRNILRRLFRHALQRDRASFWHCRKITTHWKYNRDNPAPENLECDPTSASVLESVFEGERAARRGTAALSSVSVE